MTVHRLFYPEDIYQILSRQYKAHQANWLMGNAKWPLQINLGSPNEDLALQQPTIVLAWVTSWKNWRGTGEISWRDLRFRILGSQQLPHKITFKSSNEIVTYLGETLGWQKATTRYQDLTTLWPCLAFSFKNYFDVLVEYTDDEINKLKILLTWLERNPNSNLYPRQLPVAGIDSKWLEQHKALINHLVTTLQGNCSQHSDLWQRCGLKQLPVTLRLRLLDPTLREQFHGIGDMTVTVNDIANLKITISTVFIVENLQTGLAFEDLPGTIVIMSLGYGIDILKNIPWLPLCNCIYWGDIDTHGFAILNRARSHLPQLKSLLMDAHTLNTHQALSTYEKKPHSAAYHPHLTLEEQAVYTALKQQHWGQNIRLEQERIPWDYAWSVIEGRILHTSPVSIEIF